jgi:hypothetical protein
MSRSERIAQQLGMSHGAAASRLRKNILFSLLKELNKNACSKCLLLIESVDDLSIEHIKPWENRSADLFWDLDNIAFSHSDCNRPHSYNSGGQNKKIATEGMAWCSPHQRFEPSGNFFKNVAKANGLAEYCKEARPERK